VKRAVVVGMLCLGLTAGAGAAVLAASDHAGAGRSYSATFHDAFVSGDPAREVHRGTFVVRITKGSTKLSRLVIAVAAKLGLRDVLKGSYVAVLDAPDGSDTESGTALVRPSAHGVGTLCVTFTATYDQQSNATATWKTAGGTGEVAALHASGTLKAGAPLTTASGTGSARLGARVRPSHDCAALASEH
jgi:hypothetical protein